MSAGPYRGSAGPRRGSRRLLPDAGRRVAVPAAALVMLLVFAALTAVVLATAPGVFGPDARLAAALHRPVLERPALASLLEVIAVVTHPNGVRLIAAAVAIRLWRAGSTRAATWLVVTMTVGGALGIVLKQVFERSRPEWPEAITVVSGYSFPSGHALNSMLAAACAVVLLRPVIARGARRSSGLRLMWVTLCAYVLLVGFDRVALGVHYLTDVLAGWALALAVVLATLATFGGPGALSRTRSAQPAAG